MCYRVFFFNATATTEIYTLSLHDALPISRPRGLDTGGWHGRVQEAHVRGAAGGRRVRLRRAPRHARGRRRSEEHTSELQSRVDLVCRLLLEKKKPRRTTPCRTA